MDGVSRNLRQFIDLPSSPCQVADGNRPFFGDWPCMIGRTILAEPPRRLSPPAL